MPTPNAEIAYEVWAFTHLYLSADVREHFPQRKPRARTQELCESTMRSAKPTYNRRSPRSLFPAQPVNPLSLKLLSSALEPFETAPALAGSEAKPEIKTGALTVAHLRDDVETSVDIAIELSNQSFMTASAFSHEGR